MADSNSKTLLEDSKNGIINFSLSEIKRSPVYFVWLILMLIAFWGVWRWYFLRLSTSNDEFYGILSLLAVVGICFLNKETQAKTSSLYFSTALIILYAVTYNFLPPLLRAVIAVTSLTFFLSGWRFGKIFHFGIWSLFLLSLPIIASLQFYLGFPLRVVVGEATVFLLKLNGLPVFREGVCLHFEEKLIWIDAPCSGIKMLWAGFFLTAILTTVYRLNLAKSLFAFAIAFVIILIGNIFRATSLFYLEAEIIKMPSMAHEGIGVVCFILTCVGIVFALQKLNSSNQVFEKQENHSLKTTNKLSVVFLLACLVGIIAPFGGQKMTITIKTDSVEFPTTIADRQLQELDLTEREKYFLEDFPGQVRRFTDGRREIIIRFITQATRKLHPSADCFSAIGYRIKPLPLQIDEKGDRWSCFSASKDGETLKVCERIYTDSGDNWTDVSAWYWSALSDTNPNGYWAITTAESE